MLTLEEPVVGPALTGSVGPQEDMPYAYHGPAAANKFVYFVDQDWNMPIGYLFLTPDDVQGMKLPRFNAAFWTRGDASNFQAHLFYKGNEVGKLHSGSDEVGAATMPPVGS